MERVGRLEPLPGGVGVEVADHLLVVLHPVGVGGGGLLGFFGQAGPVEEPAADDLGVVGLGRHDDRLAQPVEQLLDRLVVALILGRHLQLGGRDRDAQDDVLAAAGFLGEVLEEVVELVAELALAWLRQRLM